MDHDALFETMIASGIILLLVLLVVGLFLGWWRALFFPGTTSDIRYPIGPDDDPTRGSTQALVWIVVFSDYECPFCAAYDRTIEETMKFFTGDDGNETSGDSAVLYAFRDFPLRIHPKAFQSAKAAGCAFEQQRFWEYHASLFAHQDAQEIGDLREYAGTAGLNLTLYDECFSNDRRAYEIQEDMAEAARYGVTGTPTTFINGKRYVGALTQEQLVAAIDEARGKTTS